MPASWIVLFGLLWLVVIVLIILVLGLSQRLTAATAVGTALGETGGAPALKSVLPIGSRLPLEDKLLAPASDRGRTAIVFLSSSCGPCRALADRLLATGTDSQRTGVLESGDELVVVTDPAGANVYGALGRIVVEEDQEFGRALGVSSTPMGFGVDRDGTLLAVNLLANVADVIRLVTTDDHPNGATVSAPTGESAPVDLDQAPFTAITT